MELEALKYIGVGLCSIAMGGAALGVGHVLGCLMFPFPEHWNTLPPVAIEFEPLRDFLSALFLLVMLCFVMYILD